MREIVYLWVTGQVRVSVQAVRRWLKEKDEQKGMKRDYDDMDEWLRDRIDQDLMDMADERERLLMESEGLPDLERPMEKLEEIHREIEARRYAARRIRLRRRMVIAAAAVLVFSVGLGLVGSGSRLYKPEVVESEYGDDTIIKINNEDTREREYAEEEVCQQIEEKLGALPVRFGYRPDEMYLLEYWIKEDVREAFLNYDVGESFIYVYISKDFKESSINSRVDAEEKESLIIKSCGVDTKVLEYQNSKEQTYYSVSFEYLNTYYSFIGAMEREEFIKILQNIAIKNV
ncbi:MAG: DUF4367 domain-containing protein [Lachnospiraceae bacterium]